MLEYLKDRTYYRVKYNTEKLKAKDYETAMNQILTEKEFKIYTLEKTIEKQKAKLEDLQKRIEVLTYENRSNKLLQKARRKTQSQNRNVKKTNSWYGKGKALQKLWCKRIFKTTKRKMLIV